jgi:hypothetical protein
VSGHAAILALAIVAVTASPTYQRLLGTSLELRDPVANLLVQVSGVSYLVWQLVRFDRLNADPIVPVVAAWSPHFVLLVVALAGGLALGVGTLRPRPTVAFGILWFAVWLAPTNSIVARLDVANDRQLYLALVGPAWLVARWVATASFGRRAVIMGLVATAALLGGATANRNLVYADEVRFWEDIVRKTPSNARALNNLGYAYAGACRTEEADAAFVIALDLAPQDSKTAVNLKLLREGALGPPGRGRCASGDGQSSAHEGVAHARSDARPARGASFVKAHLERSVRPCGVSHRLSRDES